MDWSFLIVIKFRMILVFDRCIFITFHKLEEYFITI